MSPDTNPYQAGNELEPIPPPAGGYGARRRAKLRLLRAQRAKTLPYRWMLYWALKYRKVWLLLGLAAAGYYDYQAYIGSRAAHPAEGLAISVGAVAYRDGETPLDRPLILRALPGGWCRMGSQTIHAEDLERYSPLRLRARRLDYVIVTANPEVQFQHVARLIDFVTGEGLYVTLVPPGVQRVLQSPEDGVYLDPRVGQEQ